MVGTIKEYYIHTCPHCGSEYPYTADARVLQNELGTTLEVVYNCKNCGKEVVEVYDFNWKATIRGALEE